MPESSVVFAFAAIAGLFLLTLAAFAMWRAAQLKARHGLPGGRVVYSDTGDRLEAKPLYSARYRLAGKPDYLVATGDGLVPVEVKPGRTDTEPRESHLLQVLAYCLLLEDVEGDPPPYGLLRYKSETFRVDYNADTREHIIEALTEMRESRRQREVHRSHEQPGRCRGCGYREVCDEALWPSK